MPCGLLSAVKQCSVPCMVAIASETLPITTCLSLFGANKLNKRKEGMCG